MRAAEIDLNTWILSDNHQVFVARPGRKSRFFEDAIANSAVLLELPGLELEQGRKLADYDDLIPRVQRARKLRSWHRSGRPPHSEPSRDLAQYAGKAPDNSEAQLLGMVRGLFERARKGDLVIVPPLSFMQPAYIGEFTDEGDRPATMVIDRAYPDEVLPARSVRWLAEVQKRNLPLPVIDAIQKPNVFFLLERSLRERIYEKAYPSFTIGEDAFSARFDVSSVDFTSKDDLVIQAFFNFVAANTKAVDEGRPEDVLGFSAAAFQEIGPYDPDLKTNINSPGSLLLSSKFITPLVVAALLVVAVEIGTQAVPIANNGMLELNNSRALPDDACAIAVQARVKEQVLKQLQLLGLEKWPEACRHAQEAAKRTGFKGSAKMKRTQ